MQIAIFCWKCQASRQVVGDHSKDPRQQLIGVFETLAALSANGLRYRVIQAGPTADVSVAALAAGFIPSALIAELCNWMFATSFMC
jgi:hypothetical protein